jgi:hypothetical protein
MGTARLKRMVRLPGSHSNLHFQPTISNKTMKKHDTMVLGSKLHLYKFGHIKITELKLEVIFLGLLQN